MGDSLSKQENTPLHVACKDGDIQSVKTLLKHDDCDINCCNAEGSTPLHLACQEGHAEIVRVLLSREECNLTCQDEDGDTPLHIACYTKDDYSETVRLLLEKGCDPNCKNNVQRTPLHIAARYGNISLTRVLLATKKCDLNHPDRNGNIPLHYACCSGQLDIFKLLVEQKDCDINCRNREDNSPLHLACQEGHSKIVQIMLTKECMATCQNEDGDTPLHMACYNEDDHSEIVRVLVEKGCDPNSKNRNQRTPLHIAAHKGNIHQIHVLLATKKCNLDHPDKKGNIPLHYACFCGSLEATKALLSCNLNFQNKIGDTPLHVACHGSALTNISNPFLELMFENLEAKAQAFFSIAELILKQPNCLSSCTNKHGITPLHIVCEGGQLDIFRLLFEKSDCDINCKDKKGNTPLHLACHKGHSEIVRMLLSKEDCRVTCQDKDGDTPLHLACHKGHSEIVQMLLSKEDCAVACQDKDGDTPLHMACYCKNDSNIKIITLLVEKGCDPNCQNKEGITPLRIATSNRNRKMMVVLQGKECTTPNSSQQSDQLHYACRTGQIENVQRLLNKDCDINCTDRDGDTPLHIACYTKNSNLVEILLDSQKCDPNIKNTGGTAPIHIACLKGQCDIINLLLNKKECNLNLKAENGRTALHAACFLGHTNVVKILVSEKERCDINCKDDEGATALHFACASASRHFLSKLVPELHSSIPSDEDVKVTKALLEREDCDPNCQLLDGSTPLHLACRAPNIDLVEVLLNSPKCDLNITNAEGIAPIHIASIEGHSDIVKLLLSREKCQLNLKVGNGRTALHAACFFHHTEVIGLLLAKEDCDVNCRDEEGATPLHLVCHEGNTELGSLLLGRQDCNPNCQDEMGNTPLHIACETKEDHSEVVRLLLEKGCDPNCRNRMRRTPLHFAARKGNVNLINVLLTKGVCILNLPDMDGDIPMHDACFSGALDAAKALYSHGGCDINTTNREGDTPLHVICKHITDPIMQDSRRKQYRSLAKFMMECTDCNANCQNNSGVTPLHIVCAGGELEIFKLLIGQPNCDINCRDRKGKSPLHLACHKGQSEIVQMLLSKEECAITCQDEDGDTPLHMACYNKNDHSEIVKLLLEKGCDPSCRNKKGRTPLQIAYTKGNANSMRALNHGNHYIPNGQHSNALHMACKDGQIETVKRLLIQGDCNINCTDKDGNTPLHIACQRNNSDIVEVLLNSPNCDLNVINTAGAAPIHIASMEGQTDVMDLLLSKGDCKLNLKSGNERTALHAACYFCELQVLQLLLDREDCDVNCRDQEGATPLHYVSSGPLIHSMPKFLHRLKLNIPSDTSYMDMTWKLLGRKDCNPNSQQLDGTTPLHLACIAGQVEIASILMDKNDLDPNIQDKDGDTPLHIACYRNSSDLVEILLDSPKCNPNIKNIKGMAAIHIAIVSRMEGDILRLLLCKEECNPNLKAENGRTALHVACLRGHIDAVKNLLDHKDCEINCRDEEGATPLHYACFGKYIHQKHAQFGIEIPVDTCYVQIAKEILKRKDCQPNCRLVDGSTPLHLACSTGQVETAKLLLSTEGCDPNCIDKDGDTPLHIACRSQKDRSSIITALLQASNPICDPNIQNKAGMTPLHIACIGGRIDHISLLLSNKDCKCTMQTKNGQTCLHIACFYGQLDVVKLLLGDTPLNVSTLAEQVLSKLFSWRKKKYDVHADGCGLDIRDDCKTTALHFACIGGNIEVVKKLLEVKNWDINCKTETGDTPLHFACEGGHANIVTLLLEDKRCKLNPERETMVVEVNNRDNIRRNVTRQATPLGIACEAKNIAVLKALLNCKHQGSKVHQLGHTPHLLACRSGDLTVLKILLSKTSWTFNSNQVIEGTTLLHEASANGHLQIVQYLVNTKRCQCDISNSDGNYPIHVACANGHKHIVEFLEDQGSPVLNENNQNLLHVACKHGHIDIVEFLISRSGLLDSKDKDGNTPLHHACSGGHNGIVIRFITRQQCPINVINNNGEKPLHISCRKLQLDNICVLLRVNRCELGSLNAAGKTPLYEAVQAAIHVDKDAEETQYDALSIISTLVNDRRCHARPDDDQLGETPLMVAVSQPYSEYQCHLVEAILHAKHSSACTHTHCKPVCDSKIGDTVLHGACKHGNLKLLEYLIGSETYDLYCKNQEGDTLLHVACYHLHLNIVEYLLQKHSCNKQLNSQNEHLNTPVHNLFHHTNLSYSKQTDRAAIAKLVFACPSFDSNIQNKDGNTAVHLVCQDHDLCSADNVALLIDKEGYNPNLQNKCNSNTALHELCSDEQKHLSPQKRKEILQHLIKHPDLNPCVKNEDGNTPLHLMFQCGERWWDSTVLKLLLQHVRFDPNIQNTSGDTVLHVLCHRHCNSGSLSEQKNAFCLLIKHTDLSIRNVYGNTILHLLLQDTEWWDSDLVEHLVGHEQFDPNTENANGDTILHVLCDTEHVSSSLQKRKQIFRQLIDLPKLNPFIKNVCGNTPLHLMLRDKKWWDSDLLKYLKCKEKIDPNIQNKAGDTILHILLSQSGTVFKVKTWHEGRVTMYQRQVTEILLQCENLDPNIPNQNKDTPLHLLVQKFPEIGTDFLEKHLDGYLDSKSIHNHDGDSAIHILLRQLPASVESSTVDKVHKIITRFELKFEHLLRKEKSETLLHIAAARGSTNIIQMLIQKLQFNPVTADQKGNTPLHLACQHGHLRAVKALLSCGKVNFNAKNNKGKTPLQLAAISEVSQALTDYQKVVSQNPLEPFMKLFVIGDPGAGKSTLIKCLFQDVPKVVKFVPKAFRKVTKAMPDTPGIIPYTFTSKILGNVLLYDFAGQDEYYTSHSAVLQHSVSKSPPIFLLVVKMTDEDAEITNVITKWLNFIRCCSSAAINIEVAETARLPQLIIIMSHADKTKLRSKHVEDEILAVAKNLQDRSSNSKYYGLVEKVICLDCRILSSPGVLELQEQLKKSKEDYIFKTDVGCNILYAHLTAKTVKPISITSLANLLSPEDMLPSDPSLLFKLALQLNETGHILLLIMKNSEESLIITDEFRKVLLHEINGRMPLLENPPPTEESVTLARCVGIVPRTELNVLFSNVLKDDSHIDLDLIMRLMIYLEFCHEIPDSEIIDKLIGKEGSRPPLMGRCYFFPHVISKERPEDGWKLNETAKCGWCLRCTTAKGSLTSRFLHVLLRQLVSSFISELHEDEKKECNVWKRGLRWTENGIKTIVEVGRHNESVVVLVSCNSAIQCAKHRTAVINMVMRVKKGTCDPTVVEESLISPQKVSCLVIEQLTGGDLKSLDFVAHSSINGCRTLEYREKEFDHLSVLAFDPYYGLDGGTIQQLFSEANSIQEVNDDFLENLAVQIEGTDLSLFEKLVSDQLRGTHNKKFIHMSQQLSRQDSEPSKCLTVLKCLRDTKCGTFQALRSTLNDFSILHRHLNAIQNKIKIREKPDCGSTLPPCDTTPHEPPPDMDHIPEDVPELKDLVELPITMWHTLGIKLGLSKTELDEIQANNAQFPDFNQRCICSIFSWWLQTDESPTYRRLVKVLLEAGDDFSDAVRKIQTKYNWQSFGHLHLTSEEVCDLQLHTFRNVDDDVVDFEANVETVDAEGEPLACFQGQKTSQKYVSLLLVPYMDPVEVVMCDSKGGVFYSSTHDFGFEIPEGAIPEGESINIEVGVTLTGPFDFPQGSKPVSPIVKLCVQQQPNYQFLKPVEVVLPHYLNLTSEEDGSELQIGFLKAGHTLNDNQEYKFQQMDLSNTHFKHEYGIILTNHFCFLCIGKGLTCKDTAEACFYLVGYQKLLNPSEWRIYFCVAYLLETCVKALEKQFPVAEGYRGIGFKQRFKFANQPPDERKLEIKYERGLSGEWMPALESADKIKATDVDFWSTDAKQLKLMHKQRMYPPRFQIHVCATHRACIPILFQGAEEDIKMELLLNPANSVNHTDARRVASMESEPELCDLMNKVAVRCPNKWWEVGLQLGMTASELESLREVYGGNSRRCFSMIFESWKEKTRNYSWAAIIIALKAPLVAETRLAEELKATLGDPCCENLSVHVQNEGEWQQNPFPLNLARADTRFLGTEHPSS